MSEPTYRPVLPKDHSEVCNLRHYHETGNVRYLNAWSMPTEDCERCLNLWQRLEEAGQRR